MNFINQINHTDKSIFLFKNLLVLFLTSLIPSTVSAQCLGAPDSLFCTEIFLPVCGCDGNTYGNECEARVAGVQNWTEGSCTSNDNSREGDSLILIQLYEATNGANWKAPWDLNLPMNLWPGVFLSDQGRVASLTLGFNKMEGTVPPEMGNLSELEVLRLHSNRLSGPIPPELGQLTKLRDLLIDVNEFTGTIPIELSQLVNLKQLSLSINQLTGPIPPELGNLVNLTGLWLDVNQLSGSIPTTFGNFTNLDQLGLDTNQLSGTIPLELGQLTNLTAIDLSANQLSGSIPSVLGNLTNLNFLGLQSNQFSGALPETLINLPNLSTIYLHSNQLEGCFPDVYQQFCGIDYNFSNNPDLAWVGDFARFCNNEDQNTSGCNEPKMGSSCPESLELVSIGDTINLGGTASIKLSEFPEEQFIEHLTTDGLDIGAHDFADFDLDGDLDILSVSYITNEKTVYENNGNQVFTAITTSTGGPGFYVYASDVDGDGDKDLISSEANGDLVWYENEGALKFDQRRLLHNEPGVNYTIFTADIDNDGDTDILTTHYQDNTLSWYRNEGNKNFAAPQTSMGSNNLTSVFALDIDNDNFIDLLTSSEQGAGQISWCNNTADTAQQYSNHTKISSQRKDFPFVQGVNKNGQIIIVASVYDQNEILRFVSNDNGDTFIEQVITTDLPNPAFVYNVDIDQDDDLDIIATSHGNNQFTLLKNDGNNNFTEVVLHSGSRLVYAYTYDLDKDQDLDLIWAANNQIVWHEQQQSLVNPISITYQIGNNNPETITGINVERQKTTFDIKEGLVAGDNTVTILNISDATGCSIELNLLTNILVEETCSPVFTNLLGQDLLVCDQTSVTLNPNTPATSYRWATSINENLDTSSTTFPALEKGIYYLTITDESNCEFKDSVIIDYIDQPFSLGDDLLACEGEEVNLSIPVQANKYFWNEEENTQDILVTTAGIYKGTAIITSTLLEDECSYSDEINVEFTPVPIPTFLNAPQFTCESTTLSLMGAEANGNATGITFNWTTPNGNIIGNANQTTIEIDQPGTYYLELISQNLGCTFGPDSILISANEDLPQNAMFDILPISCLGAEDGAITVTSVDGGQAPFRYSLEGGDFGNSNQFPNLPAGEYGLVIQDANGCSINNSLNILEPEPIQFEISTNGTSCNGANDGSINIINIEGGQAPYEYSLDGITFMTNNLFENLPSGNYEYFVRDANGCPSAPRPALIADSGTLQFEVNATNASCNGANDGALRIINIEGGQAPYSYSMDGILFGTNNQFVNLPAGNFDLFIQDNNGCAVSTTAIVQEEEAIQFEYSTNMISCLELDGGRILAENVKGGTPPYSYSIDGINFSNTPLFSQLNAGVYTLFVKDRKDCQATSPTISIIAPDILEVQIQADKSGTLFAGEKITLTTILSGGNPNEVNYTWSGEDLDCDNCATVNAAPFETTDYFVKVEAEAACSATDTFTVRIAPYTDAHEEILTLNGDEKNASLEFTQDILDEEKYPNNEIIIFNRWGQEIYSAKPYRNDWVGTNQKGDELPQGTYYYVLRLNIGEGQIIHGTILILK